MGILFWIILFVVMGALIGKVKTSWKEGKVFNSIVWIIISLVIFCVFAFVRQYTVEHGRSEIKNNFNGYSTNKSTYVSENNSNNENKIIPVASTKGKTLGEMALDAPHPVNYVTGMSKIKNLEGLYLEFNSSAELPKDSEHVISDSVDSLNENELKIVVIRFPDANMNDTFAEMTEQQRKQFVYWMKNQFATKANETDVQVSYIGDGYFKVNGNVVIWISATLKLNDFMSENAFYYYVAKNQKIYSLSYFTINTPRLNEPNDTILTSLNTLRFE